MVSLVPVELETKNNLFHNIQVTFTVKYLNNHLHFIGHLELELKEIILIGRVSSQRICVVQVKDPVVIKRTVIAHVNISVALYGFCMAFDLMKSQCQHCMAR